MIRTTNLLERLLVEERRRVRAAGHLFGERVVSVPIIDLGAEALSVRLRTMSPATLCVESAADQPAHVVRIFDFAARVGFASSDPVGKPSRGRRCVESLPAGTFLVRAESARREHLPTWAPGVLDAVSARPVALAEGTTVVVESVPLLRGGTVGIELPRAVDEAGVRVTLAPMDPTGKLQTLPRDLIDLSESLRAELSVPVGEWRVRIEPAAGAAFTIEGTARISDDLKVSWVLSEPAR